MAIQQSRISLRTSLVITIAAIGLVGLALALVVETLYRNFAIEHQRVSVVQMIEHEADGLLVQLRGQSYRLAEALGRDPELSRALGRNDPAATTRTLDAALQTYAAAVTRPASVKLLVYGPEFDLRAESSVGTHAFMFNSSSCRNLIVLASTREPSKTGSGVSGACTTNGHPYLSVAVPLTVGASTGYLQVVTDPSHQLLTMEKVLDMPLRLSFMGRAVYQSPNWPAAGESGTYLFTSYTQALERSASVQVEAAKNLDSLYDKLNSTRYLVIMVAGVVTLTAVAIALVVLQRTALNPLRALGQQLSRIRQDRRHLGQRVHVYGNAEVSELAAGFNEMTTRLKELYESLEHMAFTDPLTKLPNRVLFHDRLQQAILTARREGKPFALFIMDLDNFKDVNDTLGHHVGDLVLQQVGERLRDKLRQSDTVARMGGDEFAILLATVSGEHAEMAARMLLKTLRQPFMIDGHSFEIGASIGIALYPEHGEEASTLIQRADVGMYEAKNSNSGFSFYKPELDQNVPNRLALMGELRLAVDYEQFVLFYQPTLNLQNGRLIGVEALVRWQHPEKEIVLPDAFIPLMEQSGLIRSLTPWVLEAALRDCARWRQQGLDISVSVNLSARDLQDPFIADSIADLVAACGARPEWLELEITESAVMLDPIRALAVLGDIARMGIKLSIDDFGTGYSSLGYLKKLPVSTIKIDKSFVMGMAADDNDATIVRSSVDLAHNMGLKVIAEGVGSETAISLLRTLGCDAAQGNFISPALPVAEFEDWLRRSPWTAKFKN